MSRFIRYYQQSIIHCLLTVHFSQSQRSSDRNSSWIEIIITLLVATVVELLSSCCPVVAQLLLSFCWAVVVKLDMTEWLEWCELAVSLVAYRRRRLNGVGSASALVWPSVASLASPQLTPGTSSQPLQSTAVCFRRKQNPSIYFTLTSSFPGSLLTWLIWND